MMYLKDINIFGYIDAKGDVAKVSKMAFTNQIVKNLINLKFGDARLTEEKYEFTINSFKFSTDYGYDSVSLSSLMARVMHKLPQVKDIKIIPLRSEKTVTFDVSYQIEDSISKNIQTSTFKFTIDK